jgi:kynurenine formamidase
MAGNMKHKSIKYRGIVNLSHPITTEIPLWPGDPPVEFETVATLENDGYFLRRFSIGEHSATHMNAPNSFHADGQSIDKYEPDSLVRKAVVIDVREKTLNDPDYVISRQDIRDWEKKHRRIPADTLVLFYTGWQEKWHNPEEFFNIDGDGMLHFPGIGRETTRFLLDERHIAGVGIDTHGVDPGLDEEYATNTQVLANNGIVLECLTNLDKLPALGTTLVIGLPLLEDGSGSPVAVLAFAP